MSIDFNEKLAEASISELEQLTVQIEKLIEERKTKEINDARIQVREMAKFLGITLEELMIEPEKPAKSSKKAVIKYRNAENQSWTGRGKQPKWLTQALENGLKLEDFAV